MDKEPDPITRELTVSSIHPGVTRDRITAATGWPIRFKDQIAETLAPTTQELDALRALELRTAEAHGR